MTKHIIVTKSKLPFDEMVIFYYNISSIANIIKY